MKSLCVAIHVLIVGLSISFAEDTDHDGIQDELERRILEFYCPWLYFDNREPVWPCSATWFVQHSCLINDPQGDVDQSILEVNPHRVLDYGTWTPTDKESSLKININDDFRTGQFADDPDMSVNVPIYGHVVQLSDSDESKLSYPGFSDAFGNNYIAVQYWILFPYNDCHNWDGFEQWYTGLEDIGDHEGDWVWIDILLNRASGLPQYVVYHHHGDGRISPSVVPWNDVEKRDGAPVIYLEKGTHELWPEAGPGSEFPTADFDFLTTLVDPILFIYALGVAIAERENLVIEPHEGDGVRYRPSTVINMGEAGHPIIQSSQEAQLDSDLVLLFNGKWGDFMGPNPFEADADNPRGPVNQTFPIYSGSQQWPENIYVDFRYNGPEIGTPIQPLSNLTDAVLFVAEGGKIIIREGTSSECLTISKPCTIVSSGGLVTIGQ